jgi:outer membrane protein assembly factor BamB
MANIGERQRRSRLYLWVIGGLVVAFGLFVAYHFFYGDRFTFNPDLMSELKGASLEPSRGKDAVAAQWPQWRGPHRDGVSPETGWLTQWPREGPPLLWKHRIGQGYSSVAVANGRVYTMGSQDDQEVVFCLEAAAGKEKWRQSYAAPAKGDRKYDTGYGAGPRSTPTVSGKYLYTVGATGLLYCWNATSGKRIWRRDLFQGCTPQKLGWGFSCSPLIEHDLLFVNPGGSEGHSLMALDPRYGDVVWHKRDEVAGYSSPIPMKVGDIDQVLFFTARGLISVAPATGKLFWEYSWETDYDCNIATPIVVGNYVFISSNYGHGCAMLKVSKAAEGGLQADRVYEGNRMCNHFSTSVFYKDHIYGFNDNLLTCMDFRTGKIVWKQKGFKKGSLTVAGGYLIVLGENGKLAVAEASPDGYHERSTFAFTRNKTWTVPVLAKGRLFVRDESDLYCYDLRKSR